MGPPHSPRATLTRPSLLPDLAALTLNSGSSGASDQDTLAPLPHPAAPWPLGQGYPYQYPGPPPCFPPAYQDPGFGYGSGSAGSQQSEGERSGPALPCPARCPAAILAPPLCACQRQAPNWSQSWGTGSSPMQGPQAPGGLGACAWQGGGWCCRCGSQEARRCDRSGGGGGPRHQEVTHQALGHAGERTASPVEPAVQQRDSASEDPAPGPGGQGRPQGGGLLEQSSEAAWGTVRPVAVPAGSRERCGQPAQGTQRRMGERRARGWQCPRESCWVSVNPGQAFAATSPTQLRSGPAGGGYECPAGV